MRCDAYRPASAGIAQLAEHQPSKLRVAGSNPVSRSTVNEIESVELKASEKREMQAVQGATKARSEAYRKVRRCGSPQIRGAHTRCGKHRGNAPHIALRSQAHVAQSAERVLGKDEVSGSIPLVGSIRTQG